MHRIPVVRWLSVAAGTTTLVGGAATAVWGFNDAKNMPLSMVRFGRTALTVSSVRCGECDCGEQWW